jgi:peptidoglycan biosynthesis protein MviN/MurJ (putative lipid II flippase)
MAGLAGVIVAGPVAESLRSASLATTQTARVVRVDVAVYTTGLVLKAAGFWAFGVLGLAVAASLQHVLSAAALTRSLRRLVQAQPTPAAGRA